MQEIITTSCCDNLEHFEKQYSSHIVDHNFRPGDLVLVCDTCIEESLNCKTKPHYLGPMVVVQRTAGSSCQADVTFSSDNLSHREQTEPMLQQYSDLRV